MAKNILSPINNIVSFGSFDLKNYASTYLIRINAVGEQLEFFVKDAIADSLKLPQDK
ncbi:MAG: NgoPII family restriction endonuclease, partial [Candidatus Aenigmarchaeota archaeon]|nr:NgoPII family restriction endonuclease [Candidatus Aenigmarchaeota archaeon]